MRIVLTPGLIILNGNISPMPRDRVPLRVFAFPQEGLRAACQSKVTDCLEFCVLDVEAQCAGSITRCAIGVSTFLVLALLILAVAIVVDVDPDILECSLHIFDISTEKSGAMLQKLH